MPVNRLSIFGNHNIGVYIFANDYIALVPPGLTMSEKEAIMETLNVEIVETKISGTIIDGVMVAGNNRALFVPRSILDEELSLLKRSLKKHDIEVAVIKSRHTALGNLILLNSRACLLSPLLGGALANIVEEYANVSVEVRSVMGLDIPGSLAVVTDRGGVVHPDMDEAEIRGLESILGVGLERATVNSGVPFIKTGLVANRHGVLVGELTTGPEVMRIQRGLGVGD